MQLRHAIRASARQASRRRAGSSAARPFGPGSRCATVRAYDPEDPDGSAPVSRANQARVPSRERDGCPPRLGRGDLAVRDAEDVALHARLARLARKRHRCPPGRGNLRFLVKLDAVAGFILADTVDFPTVTVFKVPVTYVKRWYANKELSAAAKVSRNASYTNLPRR